MDQIPPELRIVEYQNEWIVRGRFPFAHEPCDTPQLAELRERYRLEAVIEPGRTEWEQLLLLKEWVRRRWDHGWSTAPIDNALEILGKAEREDCDFNCGYYATTFVQCALALGFTARRIGVGKASCDWMAPDEGNIGHAIAEVWSQDHHKWVVLDPDMNVHYEHQGVPLSGLDVHDLWTSGRWREARLAHGPTPFATTKKTGSATKLWDEQAISDIFADFTRYNAMDYYTHLRWEMRNDYFSSDRPVPMLRWFDHSTPPQLVQANRPIRDDHWTCDERDAYWTLNQVHVDLRLVGDDLARPSVRVCLEHSMPNLDRIMIKCREVGPWEPYRAAFTWELQPGKNVIEARPVSKFGREGYTSRVVLRSLGGRV